MKKKVVILWGVTLLLVLGWMGRVLYIKSKAKDAKIEIYKMGEAVAIEDNYFVESTEQMGGYEIIVNDAEVLEIDGGVIVVALITGSQMDFHLPFALLEEHYKRRIWNNIEEYPIKLVVSKYPVKKMITIVDK